MNSPMPEAADAIDAQMRWLLAGKRRAVLLTPGTATPVLDFPSKIETCLTRLGVFYYDSHKTSPGEIYLAMEEDTVGELLGYGIPCRPEVAVECICIRGADGREKQSVVVGKRSESRDHAYRAAELMADPDDSVTVEPAIQIVKERTDELGKHELTFHKWEPGDEAPLSHLAKDFPQARMPHNPTWLIRLAGEVVGAVGINSLPLFHLWLPDPAVTLRQSRSALHFIENTYRASGTPLLAGLVDVDCNSYPFKGRLGYTEFPDERICFKLL